MKKKIFLAILVVMTLACLFAVCASADTVVPSTSNAYGDLTTFDDAIGNTNISQVKDDGTVARTVLYDGSTYYYTVPTTYILTEAAKNQNGKVGEMFNLSFTEISSKLGFTVSKASIIRSEVPSGIDFFCNNSTESYAGCANVKEIILSDGISFWDDNDQRKMFANCSSLEYVDCSGMIFKYAKTTASMFENCKALKTVILPDAYVSNGKPLAYNTNYMFNGCTLLETVENFDGFAAGLTSVGQYAFQNCYTLKSFGVDAVGTITIPEGVTSINTSAFYNCQNLVAIKMPTTLNTINATAFRDCVALEFVEFGNNQNALKMPSWGVFYGCISLKAISLPVNTVSIPDRGFSNCKALTAVYLGEKLEAILGNKGDSTGDGPAFASNTNMYFVQNSFSVLKADGSFYLASEYVAPEKPEVYYFPSTLKQIVNSGNTNDYFYMRDFKYLYNEETVTENGITTITKVVKVDENGFPVISYGSNNVPNFDSAVLDKDGKMIVNDYVYLYEYETNDDGSLVYKEVKVEDSKNKKVTYTYYPIIKRDAEGNIVYRLDENGEKIKLYDSRGMAFIGMDENGIVRSAGSTDRGISGCTNLNSVLVFPEGFTGYYDGTKSRDENQRGDILGDGFITKCATAENPITLVFLGEIDRVSMDRKSVNTSYLTYMFANPANTGFDNTTIGTWYSPTDTSYSSQTEMYVIFCHAEGGAQKYKINFEASADNKYYPVLKTTQIAATEENLGEAQNWHIYEPGTDYESEATCTLPAGEFKLCFCGKVCYSKAVEGSVALGHDSEGAAITIYYPELNGAPNYFANSYHAYVCQRCEESVDEEIDETALFTEKGYSKEVNGNIFTYGISLNKAAEKAYVENGNVISYGFIIGIVNGADGKIMNADGTSNLDKYILTDFAKSEYTSFSIYNVKMLDLSEEQKAWDIYCCAYVIDDDKVYYAGETVTTEALTISYNRIPPITETPDSGDEE